MIAFTVKGALSLLFFFCVIYPCVELALRTFFYWEPVEQAYIQFHNSDGIGFQFSNEDLLYPQIDPEESLTIYETGASFLVSPLHEQYSFEYTDSDIQNWDISFQERSLGEDSGQLAVLINIRPLEIIRNQSSITNPFSDIQNWDISFQERSLGEYSGQLAVLINIRPLEIIRNQR